MYMLIEESEWKDHPFWTNYQVTKSGEVRNKKTKKVSRHKSQLPSGYYTLTVSHNNIGHYTYRHKLVAETFIEGHESTDRVVFIDGNKGNYHLSNLKSKKVKQSKKTIEKMAKIAKMSRTKSIQDINQETEYSYQYIGECLQIMKKNKYWKKKYCRVSILGLIADSEKGIKRHGFPKLIPEFNDVMTRKTISDLISEGKLKDKDGVLTVY